MAFAVSFAFLECTRYNLSGWVGRGEIERLPFESLPPLLIGLRVWKILAHNIQTSRPLSQQHSPLYDTHTILLLPLSTGINSDQGQGHFHTSLGSWARDNRQVGTCVCDTYVYCYNTNKLRKLRIIKELLDHSKERRKHKTSSLRSLIIRSLRWAAAES